MVQNASLMAALSKGGGGSDGGGSSCGNGRGKDGHRDRSGRHKKPWKEKKLCPNCNKVVAECFSLEVNKDKCPMGWGTKRGE